MHCNVLVVGHDYESVLAPYNENLDVEPHWQKIYIPKGLKDTTQEGIDEYVHSLYDDGDEDIRQNDDGSWEYYTTYNSEGHWDWYQLGGRWAGALLLKPDAIGTTGGESWAGSLHKPNQNMDRFCDQTKKGDVNWERMRLLAAQDLRKYYNDEDSQTEYIKKIRAAMTEDDYALEHSRFALHSFCSEATGWIENSEHSWSFDHEVSTQEWPETFAKLLDAVDDDEWISVVDCHQ